MDTAKINYFVGFLAFFKKKAFCFHLFSLSLQRENQNYECTI